MNIVYQLMSGGNGDFMDLYEELPWLELIEYPGQEVIIFKYLYIITYILFRLRNE